MQEKEHQLALLAKQLDMLNPLHLMVKGYSKIEKNQKAIQSVQDVAVGDSLSLTVIDGIITTCVEEVTSDGRFTQEL